MARILNFMTWCISGLFWISLVTINCLSWTPFIICMACWLWLAVAAYKKGWYFDFDEEDDADV